MIARRYQPVNVPGRRSRAARASSKVAAARSEDGKTLVLRVVNTADGPVAARLGDRKGSRRRGRTAAVEELAGADDAVNTAAEPRLITPQVRSWRHGLGGAAPLVTFAARSFTVLTFRVRAQPLSQPSGVDARLRPGADEGLRRPPPDDPFRSVPGHLITLFPVDGRLHRRKQLQERRLRRRNRLTRHMLNKAALSGR